MRIKIRLDTASDAVKFSNIAAKLDGEIYILDGNGLKASAKSVMGALYSLEFNEIWCESEHDYTTKFLDFII